MNLEKIIAVRPGKTIYRDEDKTIKLFDENYSKANVLNEALNQARVEESALNVPKIIEVTKIDGKWAIISEFIEGKTLSKMTRENPEKIDEYFDLFVDLQLQIHKQKVPLLNKLKDKMNRKIGEANIDPTLKFELYTRLDGMSVRDKLCHGDFAPSNIIVKEDGTPYIIDWAHATQGSGSADAARTYLMFCLGDNTEGAHKYLDLFCKKSGTEKQYVQKWMPIVAASQSVKGNEKEREFLLSWVSVVDFD
ncbi:aminoglycoside phosphotransferase [Clostridia bacterium]|nr:aminoglycoside phosphotransferase [Clostridia bacterium]